MQDHLAGAIAPVLSISLEPGESIVAEAGEFSWMTDSIQMSASPGRKADDEATGGSDRRGPGPGAGLSTFTATGTAGTIAFATRLPGSILEIDVRPEHEYLVHAHGLLAGTPGIRLGAGFRQSFQAGVYAAADFCLQRVSGDGRAWIGLAGEVVRFDLAAGESLRTHPGHVGLLPASVAFQLTRVPGIANRYFGPDAHHFAVLSGPGPVWLQSTLTLPAGSASAFRDGTNSDNPPGGHFADGTIDDLHPPGGG